MLKFKGKVFAVTDDMREFHDKDKDGNRLVTKTSHRVTQISMICKNGEVPFSVVLNGWDLPTTFQLPQEKQDWETPSIREFRQLSPISCECRI